MMIKTINFTYQESNGTGMPNFKPKSEYLGMDWGNDNAPGLPFITGSQDDIRPYAVEKDGSRLTKIKLLRLRKVIAQIIITA